MEYQPKTKKKKPNPKNGYQLRMNASFGEDAMTAMREPPQNPKTPKIKKIYNVIIIKSNNFTKFLSYNII